MPGAEGLFDGGADRGGVNVAINGEHAISGNSIPLMKAKQLCDLDPLNALLSAEGIETVADFSEECAARGLERAREQLVFQSADGGQLDLPLALQLRRGKGRGQQHLRQQFQSGGEIAAHDLRIDTEAIVSAVAVDAAADGLDFRGNFLRRAVFGSLQEHVTRQLSQAIVLRAFDQHATFEDGPEFDKGQAVIFLDQQPQPIGEFELLDRLLAAGNGCQWGLGRGPGRQKSIERAVLNG